MNEYIDGPSIGIYLSIIFCIVAFIWICVTAKDSPMVKKALEEIEYENARARNKARNQQKQLLKWATEEARSPEERQLEAEYDVERKRQQGLKKQEKLRKWRAEESG